MTEWKHVTVEFSCVHLARLFLPWLRPNNRLGRFPACDDDRNDCSLVVPRLNETRPVNRQLQRLGNKRELVRAALAQCLAMSRRRERWTPSMVRSPAV